MKQALARLIVACLLAGCGGAPDLDDSKVLDRILAEAIDSRLQERGTGDKKLKYAPNSEAPYTGWAKELWNNGQVKGLYQLKDGKREGFATAWHANGQKMAAGHFRDGKQEDVWIQWHENGQKQSKGSFKNGRTDGLWTRWYTNGRRATKSHWMEGRLATISVWKPDGVKCTETNVMNGNGVAIHYKEDGTAVRFTCMDGVETRN